MKTQSQIQSESLKNHAARDPQRARRNAWLTHTGGELTAACPLCQITTHHTAMPIPGTGKIQYQCDRCGRESAAHEIERATAQIAHREITVPTHRGNL